MTQQGWPATILVTPGATPVVHRAAPKSQLVVVPMDVKGALRLNDDLRSRLGLPTTVAPPSSGFYLQRGSDGGPNLGFMVTFDNPQRVATNVETNLFQLLRAAYGERPLARTWLPLTGIEGGGLTRRQSIDIILSVIGKTGLAAAESNRFVIATANDIPVGELI